MSQALESQLLEIEEELGTGAGEPYRRHLVEEAIVVVPEAVMSREECASAMDRSPGWDEHEIRDARTVSAAPDTALVTYRWFSRRGDTRYAAVMSSVYVRREGTWRLVLHQQTPESTPGDAA